MQTITCRGGRAIRDLVESAPTFAPPGRVMAALRLGVSAGVGAGSKATFRAVSNTGTPAEGVPVAPVPSVAATSSALEKPCVQRRDCTDEDMALQGESGRSDVAWFTVTTKTCTVCGATFKCGEGSAAPRGGCWCGDLPRVMPVCFGADCVCQSCLARTIAAATLAANR